MMKNADAYAYLRISKEIPFDVFAQHCPGARVVRFDVGQALFREGQVGRSFAFVVSGRIKLLKCRNKRDTILDIVEEGASVCQSVPIGENDYCCSAVADAPDTLVMKVAREEWLVLMAAESRAARALLKMISDRTMTMCARATELSAGRVTQKIAMVLRRLACKLGCHDGDDVRIEVALSRSDIAELCGTTTETAIRTYAQV